MLLLAQAGNRFHWLVRNGLVLAESLVHGSGGSLKLEWGWRRFKIIMISSCWVSPVSRGLGDVGFPVPNNIYGEHPYVWNRKMPRQRYFT